MHNKTLFEKAEQLVAAMKQEQAEKIGIQQLIGDYLNSIQEHTSEDIADSIRLLPTLFSLPDRHKSILTALVIGDLADKGYDITAVIAPLTEKLVELLERATPYLESVQYVMQNAGEEEDPYELAEATEADWLKKNPELVQTARQFEGFATSAIAVYTANPDFLQETKEQWKKVSYYTDASTGCHWLHSLSTVLFNEPALIIDLETGRGMLAELNGIVDNFQLQLLLMGSALAGNDPLPERYRTIVDGTGPQREERSIIGRWNMYNYTALQEEKQNERWQAGSDHWIWSEGCPADIRPFDGYRVILLGAPAYQRGLPVQRSFRNLKAGIHNIKVLSEEEVKNRLSQLRSAL